MKKILINLLMGICIASTLLITGCSGDKPQKQESASVQKHTCPMHPQIVKDGPGTCPICKMDLVPVRSGGDKNNLTLSESQVQLANVKTMKVGASDFQSSKVLSGRLITNPELTEIISSRYPGRIERLYVKEAGRAIAKGQPVFQIYSEELQVLEQDYLLQIKQSATFPNEKIYKTLMESAKNKLRLFGYTNQQIINLTTNNKVSPYVTVYASASGIVNEVNVSEGQYVSEGSPIFRLENFNQLWAEADVYPQEAAAIKIGTPLTVNVNGINEEFEAKIDFISPQIDPATQILKVRATINNNGNLQPGMQATVFLPKAKINQAVSLPVDAVIRDEKGAHVWVKTGENTFEPRMVKTGEEDASQVIIISGLARQQDVVISGAYLLTSEYILKKGSDPMAGHDMGKM